MCFSCSGSEAVETAIKFARARTGRAALLYADGAFHGLTCGALSMMGSKFWRADFGPLLESEAVPFGDLEALQTKLATRRFAAFFVEPVQSEAGVRIPPPEYLRAAQALCRQYGSLLVLDEIQTGLDRTGTFLAAHAFGVKADMVLLAKALSGGLVPVSAVLMRDDIYDAVYRSVKHAIIHTSTFSENSLAMRAGLATLEVLDREDLARRAAQLGNHLRARLREELDGFEMVREIRGMGLLNGIEFTAPSSFRSRAMFEAFRRMHPALFGQSIVMRLYRDHNILTQICGNHFLTLKVAPPLIVSTEQMERFVSAIREVVELAHTSTSFWTEPLALARRALHFVSPMYFFYAKVPRNCALLLAALAFPAAAETLLEQGYHPCTTSNSSKPTNPSGSGRPPIRAIRWVRSPMRLAYLFGELDRLNVLRSEFFTSDSNFLAQNKLQPDPQVKQKFEAALAGETTLAGQALTAAPADENALFANVLRMGLHADYLGLVEKRYLTSLGEVKQGRSLAERLIQRGSMNYNVYLAVGIENYLLSIKPAPVRWLLRAGGAQTDKATGIRDLTLDRGKRSLSASLRPPAFGGGRLAGSGPPEGGGTTGWLSVQFPNNRLYREELNKLGGAP